MKSTTNPSVCIRIANPTFNEGLAFARYLDEAFEGLFRSALGRHATNIVATAYMQPDHIFSYQNTIFAERDTTIVGMVTGYTAAQQRVFSEQPLKQAAGHQILRKVGVNFLCLRLRFLGTHTDGDFYLQAIAVDPEYRGQQIGSILLAAIEERARHSGSTRLFLDVAARNKGAQRFYERYGWAVEAQERAISFLPRFVVQMTKLL
jgi:ribosomal protein S18 acetylase RimI-like enzyme